MEANTKTIFLHNQWQEATESRRKMLLHLY
jgi:hypothetical protein